MLIACSLLHACNFLLGHGIIKPLDMTLHSSGLPFKHSRIEERVFSISLYRIARLRNFNDLN